MAYQLEGGSICIAWPFCQIIKPNTHPTVQIISPSSTSCVIHVYGLLKILQNKKKTIIYLFSSSFRDSLSLRLHSPLDVSAKRPLYPSPPLSLNNKNLRSLLHLLLRSSASITVSKLFFFFLYILAADLLKSFNSFYAQIKSS